MNLPDAKEIVANFVVEAVTDLHIILVDRRDGERKPALERDNTLIINRVTRAYSFPNLPYYELTRSQKRAARMAAFPHAEISEKTP